MWALLFSVKSILVVACAIILHESAHVLMCLKMNVKILGMTPLPWGLTVATPLICDRRSQIVISAAGPLCNFAVLTLCMAARELFDIRSHYFDLFMLSNLADGVLNMLPALPLDGGIILKSYLCTHFGLSGGFMMTLKITAAIGAVIFFAGMQIFIITGYNFSYTAAGLFILVNLKHERHLLMSVKKRVLTGEIKSAPKIKWVNVDSSCHALCLANLISGAYTLVFLVNDSGRFIGEVHQNTLIKRLFKNTMITVGECIEKI